MTAAGVGVPRFGRVQVEMLECVYQHRLLSTAQLHALYRDGLSLRRTQRALAAMERAGWLWSVRQPGGMKLWFVTEHGANMVESIANRVESRRKVISREQAAGPLQHHTLAVNEVGVAFARTARERGDEFGPLAWRNEIAHPIGPPPGKRRSDLLVADAVLSYQWRDGETVSFGTAFVELDRATMALEALVAKLGRYLRLEEYVGPPGNGRWQPLWRESYAQFPTLLVVLANGSRERLAERRWLVQALWKRDHADDATRIDLHVCLLEDLIEQGPFAAIFNANHTDGKLVDWTGCAVGDPDDEPEAPGVDEAAGEPEAADEREPAPDP
jgi:protein involved in plasmid replication-relaxation